MLQLARTRVCWLDALRIYSSLIGWWNFVLYQNTIKNVHVLLPSRLNFRRNLRPFRFFESAGRCQNCPESCRWRSHRALDTRTRCAAYTRPEGKEKKFKIGFFVTELIVFRLIFSCPENGITSKKAKTNFWRKDLQYRVVQNKRWFNFRPYISPKAGPICMVLNESTTNARAFLIRLIDVSLGHLSFDSYDCHYAKKYNQVSAIQSRTNTHVPWWWWIICAHGLENLIFPAILLIQNRKKCCLFCTIGIGSLCTKRKTNFKNKP